MSARRVAPRCGLWSLLFPRPEESVFGTGMAVEVVGDLAHHRVEPEALRVLPRRNGAQFLEHRRPVRLVRHSVLPPDDHRRGADLAVGDPGALRLAVAAVAQP